MKNRLTPMLKFVLVAALMTVVIGGVGGMVSAPEHHTAVWLGAGLAFFGQLLLVALFFGFTFATRPLLAHGMGMLGRLLLVGTVALFWVPWAGLPAAPLLFSLVAVLFTTTLIEPLFLVSLSTDR